MPQPTAAPWAERRLRVSTELEDIAIELMAERGYQQVSYEDVAALAGVSARTVYRYFPAKEEFLLAQVRRSVNLIEAALPDLPRTRYPINDVIELIISLSETFGDTLDGIILWSRAVWSDPEAASRVQGEQSILMERMMLAFCRDDAGRAAIDPASVRSVAATIVAITSSVFQQWVESGGCDELSVLYRAALAGVRGSLRP